MVDGVLIIKIGGFILEIVMVVEQFLGKVKEDCEIEVREVLEGYFCLIFGFMMVEEIYKNCEKFF